MGHSLSVRKSIRLARLVRFAIPVTILVPWALPYSRVYSILCSSTQYMPLRSVIPVNSASGHALALLWSRPAWPYHLWAIFGPSLYSYSMHAWVRNKDRMGFPWERKADWFQVFRSPPATALIKQLADDVSDILCQQFKEPPVLFSVRRSALADKSWTPNQIESVHLWTSEHDIAFQSTGPRIITYTSCSTLSYPLVPCWPASSFIEEE
jgi:hypothetical protein